MSGHCFFSSALFRTTAMLCALVAVSGCGSSSEPEQVATTEPGATPAAPTTAGKKTAPDVDKLHPIVKIETSHGDITLKLDAEKAPITVNNFLSLASKSYYDDTLFHYVAPSSMILGGGFNSQMTAKTDCIPIRNEAHNGLVNRRGAIAMSRQPDDIDSASSQFFINLGENPALDHQADTPEKYGYCVFGEVTSGIEVAEKIASQPTVNEGEFVQTPQERVVIKSIRVIR